MQDLTVALVQADQVWENKIANFNNYLRLTDDIEADLIILPEMFNTGFTMNTAGMSEPFDESASIDWLKEFSSSKNSAVFTSLIIEYGGSFFNRGVFITPEGELTTYDKRKTFSLASEDEYFSSGNSEVILDYKNWKINLQICYDLRFPELIRNKLINGQPAYDLLLYVANWPEKRSKHWKALLPARAIENQSYVVGVNRVGTDDKGTTYSGDSVLVDALGNCDWLKSSEEQVSTFVINKNELNRIREMLPFLKDR